jgi:hypothetical protein
LKGNNKALSNVRREFEQILDDLELALSVAQAKLEAEQTFEARLRAYMAADRVDGKAWAPTQAPPWVWKARVS